MGRSDFGRPAAYLAPPVAHALHDVMTMSMPMPMSSMET